MSRQATMFIGAINAWMRSVLAEAAHGGQGLPVYVACSGNFTIERILAKLKLGLAAELDGEVRHLPLTAPVVTDPGTLDLF